MLAKNILSSLKFLSMEYSVKILKYTQFILHIMHTDTIYTLFYNTVLYTLKEFCIVRNSLCIHFPLINVFGSFTEFAFPAVTKFPVLLD